MTIGEIGTAIGIAVALATLIGIFIKVGQLLGKFEALEGKLKTETARRIRLEEQLVHLAKDLAESNSRQRLLEQAQTFAERSMARVESEIKGAMEAFKTEVRETLGEIKTSLQANLAELRKR